MPLFMFRPCHGLNRSCHDHRKPSQATAGAWLCQQNATAGLEIALIHGANLCEGLKSGADRRHHLQ